MNPRTLCALSLVVAAVALAADKPAAPAPFKHQVTGLFSPDREADLREAAKNLVGIKLVSVDFETAEAVFEYDPAVFKGAKPDQLIQRFDNQLKQASGNHFGIKPLCAAGADKLKKIEIAVVGLDCKACSFAAYDAVARLKGVENATASFKAGLVTARVHPDMIDRAQIEAALKLKGVAIRK